MRRFWAGELERAGSCEEALSRLAPLNHATRLLHSLHRTLDEYEQAIAALIDNVERQERVDASADSELFEEGGRLSTLVHHRVETFRAFARLLLDRLAELLEGYGAERAPGRPPLLTELAGDRDLHVVSVHGRRSVRSTIWSASGDAELKVFDPGETPGEGVTLREWLDLLEGYVGDVLDYLDAGRTPTLSRTGSRL